MSAILHEVVAARSPAQFGNQDAVQKRGQILDIASSRERRRQKGEGFPGQRIVVLPRKVLDQAAEKPLLQGLLPTDVGYFPRAVRHCRSRTVGVAEAIFIYCVNGAGWCEIAQRRHPIRVGDLLVIPPGVPHAYGADPKHPWTIHWFHVQGSLIEHFLGELEIASEHPVLYLGEDPQLLALFEEVRDTVEHGYAPARLLYASHTVAHLLAAMVWRRRHHWRDEPDASQNVAQTIEYMKQHLDRSLNVAALAALANLSASHYTSLFKRQTGYAPIDYFIRLRMHRACQLLDTTDLSIKAIADQLGYDDPLYFSRVFKSVNERPPLDYRRQRKG